MALIACPECGKEISDTSEKCIHCGYVLHPEVQAQKKKKRMTLVWMVIIVLALAIGGGAYWMRSKETATFENSKVAYTKLNEAAAICNRAMSDIYEAWRWGIYEWDDKKTHDQNATALQRAIDIDLQKGVGEDSTPGSFIRLYSILYDSEWQGCIDLVVASYYASGLYQETETLMSEAQQALKAVSESNADYQYYPMLKQYYAKVSAMFEFVKSPSGSFEQLKTTKNNYANDILNFQGDLSFVFAE